MEWPRRVPNRRSGWTLGNLLVCKNRIRLRPCAMSGSSDGIRLQHGFALPTASRCDASPSTPFSLTPVVTGYCLYDNLTVPSHASVSGSGCEPGGAVTAGASCTVSIAKPGYSCSAISSTAGSGSCADMSDSEVRSASDGGTCADVVEQDLCNDEQHGALARQLCPASCNACSEVIASSATASCDEDAEWSTTAPCPAIPGTAHPPHLQKALLILACRFLCI